MNPKVAIVRGKFLNKYEMQFFEPLVGRFDITAFGSLRPYHDAFAFPVINLPSPMDLPDFSYKMPVLNRLFIDAHYLLGLESRLRGFDLVHTAETYFHYTQQCLNARREGFVKKVIATVLENIPFNNEGIWGRKAFKRRSRQELDHIIALTYKTKEALLAEGADPKKISIISHFVDTKRFKPTLDTMKRRSSSQKTITILFTGRLEEYKGVLDLLEAAKVLLNDKKLATYELRFLFVGQGSLKDTMIQREKKYGIETKVVHVYEAYDKMPEIYTKGDIFVAPSKPRIVSVRGEPIKTWDEQYCTSLLEAQANGLPIVTTKTGGIPENIGEAGLLANPGNVQELAHLIQKLILNPHMRSEYAAKARKRALEVHDISIGSKKLARLYEQVLNER